MEVRFKENEQMGLESMPIYVYMQIILFGVSKHRAKKLKLRFHSKMIM